MIEDDLERMEPKRNNRSGLSVSASGLRTIWYIIHSFVRK